MIDRRMVGKKGELTGGMIDIRMYKQKGRWTEGPMGREPERQKNGLTEEWTDRKMTGRMNRWIDSMWTDKQMDRQTDGQTNR